MYGIIFAYYVSIYLVVFAYCLLPFAYCLLPSDWLDAFGGLDAYCLRMHTASECILPLNAFGGPPGVAPPRPQAPLRGPTAPAPRPSHPGRAAECIGRRMHSAAECIQRQYAFGGSMHSEAVCIQAAECIQPGIGNRQ